MIQRLCSWLLSPSSTAAWFAVPALAMVAVLIALAFVPLGRSASLSSGEARTAPAQRIVVIAPSSAETICALGACERIVGVSKFCVSPPALLHKPRIGGLYDPDIERIIALRPDLVVLRGRSDALMTLAQQRGIAVYVDETDTLEGVVKAARDLGRLLHLEKEATQLIAQFEQRLQDISRRTVGRQRPRVFITVSRPTERLADILTAGKSSFLSEMVHRAGGDNVFADMDLAYPQVSLETIIARRPDVILELQPDLDLTTDLRNRMQDQWFSPDGPFPDRKPRLLILTDKQALIPSLGYAEFIEVVRTQLHPEAAGE